MTPSATSRKRRTCRYAASAEISAMTAQLTCGTYSRVPITSRFQKLVYSNGARARSRSFFIVPGGSGLFIKPSDTPSELAIGAPFVLTRWIAPVLSGAKERSSICTGARLSSAAKAPSSRPSARCAGTATISFARLATGSQYASPTIWLSDLSVCCQSGGSGTFVTSGALVAMTFPSRSSTISFSKSLNLSWSETR